MKRGGYHIFAAITIVFWSLAYVFTRLALPYFSAFALGLLRYLAASAALVIISVFKKLPPLRARDIPWFLLSGASGFFMYMITFNQGCLTANSATGSVVIATVPVMTALLARFIYGEKLRAYQWAAMGVELAGILILLLWNGVLSVNSGLLWLIAAAIMLSVYNILQRRLTKRYSALQTSAYSIFAGTLMLCVFLPEAVPQAQAAPAKAWLYIFILGVFSSAIAYISWSKAMELAEKTSQVSNYMFITPLLTTALALIIVREAPGTAAVAGGAVILTGSLLFNFGGALKKGKAAA